MVEENVPQLGSWGGTCRCPDENEYQVGDNGDACNSLACINGEELNCNKYYGPWSRRKVTCIIGKSMKAKKRINFEGLL